MCAVGYKNWILKIQKRLKTGISVSGFQIERVSEYWFSDTIWITGRYSDAIWKLDKMVWFLDTNQSLATEQTYTIWIPVLYGIQINIVLSEEQLELKCHNSITIPHWIIQLYHSLSIEKMYYNWFMMWTHIPCWFKENKKII